MAHIQISGAAKNHLQAYLEYTSIVGDADDGVLLSEAEYEKFKQKAIEARKHRIYVSWRNSVGIDCKLIGPASKCFCTHAYKSHATDNYEDRNIFCRTKNCECQLFDHIPVTGAWRIKCSCKHFFDMHQVLGDRPCKQAGCKCVQFVSPVSCTCGEKYGSHVTVFETREERQALGRPVDNLGGGGEGYEALGGITSFSSLVDGIERMDPSGAGGPPPHELPPPAPKKLTEKEEMALYESSYRKNAPRRR